MKYLFINSVAGIGSTGRIAAEQCRERMAQGHQCLLAYGRDIAGCEDIPTLRIGRKLDYQLHGIRSRILDDHGFGSAAATRKFLAKVREYDPDVIWLHNIHGYYLHIGLLFDYLRSCGKQIFWTLHDCWSFTGHCSHFDYVGCDRWQHGCHDCPQLGEYPASILRDNSAGNYLAKKSLFTGIPNLTLIVPSHWLERLVRQSFLGNYPVEVHYNQVDTSVFRPTASDFRSRYGLEGKYIVLGVAGVWTGRKGLPAFVELSKRLDSRYRIVLIGLTQQQIRSLPPEILGLPRTNSPVELAQAYTAADVYVSPSVEETFGMTVLEAASCGTTPIVYAGTACEEIAASFGGKAVSRNTDSLLEAIYQTVQENEA